MEVLPDLVAASTADRRTRAKIMLDAIESLLQGKGKTDVSSYAIGGRSLSKIPPLELEEWRDKYRREYLHEQRGGNKLKFITPV